MVRELVNVFSLSLWNHSRVCRLKQVIAFLVIVIVVIHPTCPNMPSETKETLRRRLEERGCFPPREATVMMLRARLAELKLEEEQSDVPVTLKAKMKELNRMSKKKTALIKYAEDLGVMVTEHNTIPQIYLKIEKYHVFNTPPTAGDLVSFGTHASLTYSQVATQHPSYVSWAAQTLKDNAGDVDWRLRRLVEWHDSIQAQVTPPRSSSPGGYPSKGHGKASHHRPADSSDGSFQAIDSVPTRKEMELMRQLEQMKQEKDELELSMGRIKSRKET